MASCIKCGQRKLRKDRYGRRKCKRCGVNPSNNHLDRSGIKMECNFRVGQKVVCINATDWKHPTYSDKKEIFPKVDEIYTIREIFTDDGDEFGCFTITLEEIRNKKRYCGYEITFYVWRFRPLVESKTDISIFQEMLKPIKEKV